MAFLSCFSLVWGLKVPDFFSVSCLLWVYSGGRLSDSDVVSGLSWVCRCCCGVDGCVDGFWVCFAFPLVSLVFCFGGVEVGASVVRLFSVVGARVVRARFGRALSGVSVGFFDGYLFRVYGEFVGDGLPWVFFGFCSEYFRPFFYLCVFLASFWVVSRSCCGAAVWPLFSCGCVGADLETVGDPSWISFPQGFCYVLVAFVLGSRGTHCGLDPLWTSSDGFRAVIVLQLFCAVAGFLVFLSFVARRSADARRLCGAFVGRMLDPCSGGFPVRLVFACSLLVFTSFSRSWCCRASTGRAPWASGVAAQW